MFGQLKQDGRQAAGSCEKTGKSQSSGCTGKLSGLLTESSCISGEDAAGSRASQVFESRTGSPGSNRFRAPGRNR